MIKTITIQKVFTHPVTDRDAQSNATAEKLAALLRKRSHDIPCPNGHDPNKYPDACITVRAETPEECSVENHGICCTEYYDLLKAI